MRHHVTFLNQKATHLIKNCYNITRTYTLPIRLLLDHSSTMTIFEFNEQLCEIIAGEDGYYNYDKQEILDLAKEMKTSAEEYENLQECKDAADAHETFYPAGTGVCDV